jgi:hypothetical protein
MFCTAGNPQAQQAGAAASLCIEIVDAPSFVQAESYRTCMHLYHHLHEQMLRYVDTGTSYWFTQLLHLDFAVADKPMRIHAGMCLLTSLYRQ